MRSVADFYRDCLSHVDQQDPLDVLLSDAVGCVLSENVEAPFDVPVTDVAGCDGYAVRVTDFEAATTVGAGAVCVHLMVTNEIKAGDVQLAVLIERAAVRIASGAPIPQGADAVVPLEFTDHGVAEVEVRMIPRVGENIRRRAEDVQAGQVVLKEGTRLSARQIGLLAGVGRSRVVVRPRPRVVVLSIGNELIEPGATARPGTVFDSNGYALSAAVADAGAETYRVAAVPDERNRLANTIADQLVRADLILTTGGISYGSGDTVREVLGGLGTVRFDSVAAWPGHIMGIGTVGEGIPIFCLPGDPVAAQVCFEVYVRPSLRKMQGWASLNRQTMLATVDRSWFSPRGLRQFVRVRVTGNPREGYRAAVMGEPGALWLSAMANSNALAVVPEDVTEVREGETLTCMVLEEG